MKRTLAVLVENQPGVLSKVAGLFGRRGFNIDSLAVGVTEDPEVSRMTIVVDGDEYTVEQVSKQLYKLMDVIEVEDITENSVIRELALIKVKAPPSVRNDVIQVVNIFRAKVVDIFTESITIEITGDSEKIAAIENVLKTFGIQETVRTGAIAISRASSDLENTEVESMN